jgi:hypothetical protein
MQEIINQLDDILKLIEEINNKLKEVHNGNN